MHGSCLSLLCLFCFYIDPQSCRNHCILNGPETKNLFRKKLKNPAWTFSQFYLLILDGRVLPIYMRPTADGSVLPWPSPSWAPSAERRFTCTPQRHVSQRRPQTVLRALYLITLSVVSAVWLDVVWLPGASTDVNAAATACRPEAAARFTIRLHKVALAFLHATEGPH